MTTPTTIIKYTGDASIDVYVKQLNDALTNKDLDAIITVFEALNTSLITMGPIVSWFTEPSVFSEIKLGLNAHLDIPLKMMQLKHRVPGLHKRAMMFSVMFLNAVRRTKQLQVI